MATATLRVREGTPDIEDDLRNAFTALYDLYGPGYFDVNVTANAVLQGNADNRYSIWYGQDFGGRAYNIAPPEVVRNLGDVSAIRTDFSADDFEEIFFATFDNTDVSVHSIVNVIYIITRYLGDYSTEQTVGRHLTRLF